MPVKGKADFMFVQHMVASVNNGGRMAVIMPHGVLFRGGEERAFRKWLIERGYLEAVIGLPPALFYGTGTPASVIVINKKDAHLREMFCLSMPTENTRKAYKTNCARKTLKKSATSIATRSNSTNTAGWWQKLNSKRKSSISTFAASEVAWPFCYSLKEQEEQCSRSVEAASSYRCSGSSVIKTESDALNDGNHVACLFRSAEKLMAKR